MTRPKLVAAVVIAAVVVIIVFQDTRLVETKLLLVTLTMPERGYNLVRMEKMMTRLLKKAFDEASRLEEAEQDAVGQWLLDELASERRWDDAFRRSGDSLAKLAEEAREEHRAGQTRPLDPDAL